MRAGATSLLAWSCSSLVPYFARSWTGSCPFRVESSVSNARRTACCRTTRSGGNAPKLCTHVIDAETLVGGMDLVNDHEVLATVNAASDTIAVQGEGRDGLFVEFLSYLLADSRYS